MLNRNKKIEIVAPAGDYKSLEAAIAAGADAVYLGLKGFGARRKASNFYMEELLKYIDFAHLRGVKLFLTLNTLLNDDEIENLYPNINKLYEAGIDAFIIQDFGAFKFFKDNFKDVKLHASTQMKISNHLEAQFLYKEGFDRLVLPRELSFEEIKSVKEKSDIALEVFVSGAICIGYSGNCYMSSFFGGRSGNRGMCAQPCRKQYTYNNETGYFLSPKDNFLREKEILMLKDIGVESIKIEGRMKNEKYVYETVKYYNDILNGEKPENNTKKIFNRGYSKAYFYGKENEKLINKDYSFNIGYKIGETLNGKEVTLLDDVKLGDGISFVDKKSNVLSGEYLNKIFIKGKGKVSEAKKEDIIILNNIPMRSIALYKSYDKALEEKILNNLKQKKRKKAIDGELKIVVGEKLELRLFFDDIKIKVIGDIIEKSEKIKLDPVKVKEKISELGETPFLLNDLKINFDEEAFISFKTLKLIKREAVLKLEEKVIDFYKRKNENTSIIKADFNENIKDDKLIISACVKTKEQKKILEALGIEKVYMDQIDIVKENILDKVNLDNNLIKNISGILKNQDKEINLDWKMNIFNSYTIKYFEKYKNINTIFLSPELSLEKIEKIKSDKINKGLLIYGYIKVMHLEYALFKTGKRIIKNENEDEFLAIINEYNNTEIYMTKPLNMIPAVDKLKDLDIQELRLDFTFEDEEEIKKIIESIKTKSGEYNPFNYEKGVL